jgi:peptidoglycan hydrolase-like protein with peptidoglycan-binding domain
VSDTIHDEERVWQIRLNRISFAYPCIPKIPRPDGAFNDPARDAVRAFQSLFGPAVTGEPDPPTRRRIDEVYRPIRRADDRFRAYRGYPGTPRQFYRRLQAGDEGGDAATVRARLGLIALFYPALPDAPPGRRIDEDTLNAAAAFAKAVGVGFDGGIDRPLWDALDRAAAGIDRVADWPPGAVCYPGRVLEMGAQGEDVEQMQGYLADLADVFPTLPRVPVTGVFGGQTMAAVGAFQRLVGAPAALRVDETLWEALAGAYTDLAVGFRKRMGQYPGRAWEVTV